MNTPLGPNLTDLETIHSLAWRVTATASVAFGWARSTAVWRRDTVHPRVDAGKGTAMPWNAPNGVASSRIETKHGNRGPQSERVALQTAISTAPKSPNKRNRIQA